MAMQSLQLDAAVETVGFDPSGRKVVAVTELGSLSLFDCSRKLQRLSEVSTDLEACEVAFSPDGSALVVTGVRIGAAVEGVVLVYHLPEIETPPIVAAVFDTMATAPTFLAGSSPLLVVGSYLRLVCLHATTYDELGFADGDDYIAPRGIAAIGDDQSCVAVWGREGSSRVHWYNLSTPSEPKTFSEGGKKEPEPLGGIAVSPSGARVVATFTRENELKVRDVTASEGTYGHLSVYDPVTRALVKKHPLPGSLNRDFTRYAKTAFGAERLLTRPVFLDESHIAVGMPGGDVLAVDLQSGDIVTKWRLSSPLSTLDYSKAAGLLAAGGPDGSLHMWTP